MEGLFIIMNLEKITHKITDNFPGDRSGNTIQRNIPNALYALVEPDQFPNPTLIHFNENLSEQIGLGNYEENQLPFLVGNQLPENIETYATAYAGHQFGNWAGQLGDGRAIYAGEISNENNITTELQWKGAGATPFSRFADGRAVLRSSVREYLMSEAMFHLGVPTTRALSLALTGEKVTRDMFYNGNPQQELGAVVLRTSESFFRFGHFELLSAQKDLPLLKQLTDHVITEYYPEINNTSPRKYELFFEKVCERTAKLIVEWYRVGFVHGVMNTDNMSILGLTIDYGPYSMLDEYDLNFTPNTTDMPGRRYAFGNQGKIAQWNLWQLANALFPLIKDEAFLEQQLENFALNFWNQHDEMLCKKFGLDHTLNDEGQFFNDWQTLMMDLSMDHTLFFTKLENWNEDPENLEYFEEVSYKLLTEKDKEKLQIFLENYKIKLLNNKWSSDERKKTMSVTNPKFILRNYLLQECIEELELGSDTKFKNLFEALQKPYENHDEYLTKKRPSQYDDLPGCTSLSCSS